MTPLKVGAICVGYGGLEMAISRLVDIEHAWHAEFDPAASKVLATHYPTVVNYGDVTKVDWTRVERVDVFAGGPPCQPFSNAGKRQGSDDERDLWPVRKFKDDGTPRRGALDAIRELMPRLVVIENVPGLLTIESGQAFATVLADLDDLGYTVSWTTVGACKVGACHHRHRVFIAATLIETPAPLSDPIAHRVGDGWGPAQFVLFGDAQAVKWPAAGFTTGGAAWEMAADPCGSDDQVFPTPNARDGGSRGTPSPEHAAKRAADPLRSLNLEDAVALLPTPMARDHKGMSARGPRADGSQRSLVDGTLANAILLLPTPTATPYGNNQSVSAGSAVRPSHEGCFQMLPTPTANSGARGEGFNNRGEPFLSAAVLPERFGKYAGAVHRHELAFGLTAPDPTEPGRNGKPRLLPAFPEFMMGLPPGWLTDVLDRKGALKAAGNGVNPKQAAYALSTLPTFRAATKALSAEQVPA